MACGHRPQPGGHRRPVIGGLGRHQVEDGADVLHRARDDVEVGLIRSGVGQLDGHSEALAHGGDRHPVDVVLGAHAHPARPGRAGPARSGRQCRPGSSRSADGRSRRLRSGSPWPDAARGTRRGRRRRSGRRPWIDVRVGVQGSPADPIGRPAAVARDSCWLSAGVLRRATRPVPAAATWPASGPGRPSRPGALPRRASERPARIARTGRPAARRSPPAPRRRGRAAGSGGAAAAGASSVTAGCSRASSAATSRAWSAAPAAPVRHRSGCTTGG